MTPRGLWRGIGGRIALAASAAAILAVAVVGLGVVIVGGQAFAELMRLHGASTEGTRSMFDASVTRVLVAAIVVALVVASVLALWLGHRLARPLRDIGGAARRIADGDYGARVPRDGPEEVASLADSFNQMAAALEEQERMRRDFIANASHELRTPLTNLTGYLEGLRDGVFVPDRETFDSLLEETERLVRLSASLSTLAGGEERPEPAVLREVDLAAAIRSALELASPAITRAGIATDLRLAPTLPARADPDGLAQVLGNLLQNAARYTPPGGRLKIRAERRAAEVVVTISNSGVMIPAEDLSRVFERFYRVEKSRDRARGGAGIGLAIVRQLVEAMGGRVGAESGGDETRFWFSVPIATLVVVAIGLSR